MALNHPCNKRGLYGYLLKKYFSHNIIYSTILYCFLLKKSFNGVNCVLSNVNSVDVVTSSTTSQSLIGLNGILISGTLEGQADPCSGTECEVMLSNSCKAVNDS